jgi:hypothetical protein
MLLPLRGRVPYGLLSHCLVKQLWLSCPQSASIDLARAVPRLASSHGGSVGDGSTAGDSVVEQVSPQRFNSGLGGLKNEVRNHM